ncbi:uncharacterized protein [Palaemon carinicauda]|uniref:uncharacterized protein n=1 Tax=Palaemon carinicauda TaxID=392227 RepID=UPI0035B65CA4
MSSYNEAHFWGEELADLPETWKVPVLDEGEIRKSLQYHAEFRCKLQDYLRKTEEDIGIMKHQLDNEVMKAGSGPQPEMCPLLMKAINILYDIRKDLRGVVELVAAFESVEKQLMEMCPEKEDVNPMEG